jgi:uncharacterized alpha-E superfamily protein
MTLLARYAECAFWMARYVERAENLARILDVQETFSRDAAGARNFLSVVQLNADTERFLARHPEARPEDVVHFYILDADNPTSIVSALAAARTNAQFLRPLISTEMWQHLNVLYNRLQALGPADLAPHLLSALCRDIKEGCQLHTGITEGTFYRDQSWHFYQLGRVVERADQTTRLLDIKYHLLLPSPQDVGSPLDVQQWNAVLRSAAGYQAFRRLHPRAMSPALVADFLLHDPAFPRSVALCVNRADDFLHRLRSGFGLRGGGAAHEKLDELRAALAAPIAAIIEGGLHEFLDWTQLMLARIADDVRDDFFAGRPRPARRREPALPSEIGLAPAAQSQA